MTAHLAPIRLAANQPRQFYRGGSAIAELRGQAATEYHPEDWVGSTTVRFGHTESGLSPLADGSWLRDAVRADPKAWLGERHVRAFADSTGLLVKLLDAGQRLPVHFHPDDAFAARHLDSHLGKTEAWIVVGTYGDDPRVHPGFREPVDRATVAAWTAEQDTAALLGALNSVPVRPGDTVFVPAGMPHAIGTGVFLVELQQPTDFSLTLEWSDFLERPEQGHLGLGFDTAIGALDTSGWDETRLREVIRHTADDESVTVDLLADGSRAFFRAEQLRPRGPLALDPSFAILVVLDGSGTLRTEHGGELALGRGDTVLVPHDAGQSELDGELTVVRARPPEPGRE